MNVDRFRNFISRYCDVTRQDICVDSVADAVVPSPGSEVVRLSKGDSKNTPRREVFLILFQLRHPCSVADPGKTPLLSFMYICVADPIWRRLLRSFVTFARSKTLVKAGIGNCHQDARSVAITTINSMRVKACANRGRGTFGHGYCG